MDETMARVCREECLNGESFIEGELWECVEGHS